MVPNLKIKRMIVLSTLSEVEVVARIRTREDGNVATDLMWRAEVEYDDCRAVHIGGPVGDMLSQMYSQALTDAVGIVHKQLNAELFE